MARPAVSVNQQQQDQRTSLENVQNNVAVLNRGANAEDIAALWAQGVEVDNEGPAPKNAEP